MNRQNPAIVVFARAPHLEFKALGLGTHASQRWHAQLLARTLKVARSTDVPVYLVSDGSGSDILQRGVGFEQRFLNALSDVAALGHSELVVIGSDTPGLSLRHLQQALSAPSCVGPSSDGGFYLLRFTAQQIPQLRGLPWHTDELLTALQQRLSICETLRTLNDVDDWHDFVRARRVTQDLDLSKSPWSTKPETPYLAPPPRPMRSACEAPRGPPIDGCA